MGRSWQIAVVRNIPLRIHWSFLLLPILYAATANSATGALRAVVFILLLFACVVLHEFGHAVAAQYYNITVREILLLPIGGLARLTSFPKKPTQELVIALAGPLVNLVTATALGLLLLLRSSSTSEGLPLSGGSFLALSLDLMVDLVRMNIFLALFNLIPAFPMDGGRVLRALLGYVVSFESATSVATWVGRIAASGFVLFGIATLNIGLAIIGIFVFVGAGAENDMVQKQAIMAKLTVREIMHPVMKLHPLDLLGRIAPVFMSNQQPLYAVMDGARFEGVVTPEQIAIGLQTLGPASPLISVTQPPPWAIPPDMSLNELYDLMADTEAQVLLVVEAEQPVGIVTAADLLQVVGS